MKQIPNWLRRALGLPERFRNGHALQVPHEVESMLNEVLERMLSGFSRDLQAATNLKMAVLVRTAQAIYNKWNELCDKVAEDSSWKFYCWFVS